ncbi:uncharacterized protein N0V89_001866 [Didymosphaeria variabile]|uniref:Uncharacterized protein n=1 Tax=Didymosphaeria variabile TaxID=1932322 RepID=A0A9W9CD09_9PLEO|nr:uncharacterized protein N0V89_001866 [Didymosphaeria variabile]KAJ4357291.1 hypothetical protein N0V89_001866 [Didymosphaeria variabile]
MDALVEQHPERPVVRADYSKTAVEVFQMVWKAEEDHLHEGDQDMPFEAAFERWKFAKSLGDALGLQEDEKVKAFVGLLYLETDKY